MIVRLEVSIRSKGMFLGFAGIVASLLVVQSCKSGRAFVIGFGLKIDKMSATPFKNQCDYIVIVASQLISSKLSFILAAREQNRKHIL